MSEPMPCGCCQGITAQTPATIGNRPGLAAISYRSGTWAQFKATMLDALSVTPALADLRTRSDDDFTIALLDAWAVVCDILTFYQERIANESYLRTATELVSVGELAKLIGYKLRPGLAASAALSFTLDAPPPLPTAPSVALSLTTSSPPLQTASSPPTGSPSSIALTTGLQAQAIPDPGMQPATFETIAPITARAEWNAIKARMTRPPAATQGNTGTNVRLGGLVGSVKVGDSLLVVVAGSPPGLQRVTSVELDPSTQTTLVGFEAGARQQPAAPPATAGQATPGASLNDDFLWASVKGCTWQDQGQLVAFATSQGWSIDELEDGINALRGSLTPGSSPPVSVYAMGIDAALFGHNAVDWNTIPQHLQDTSSTGISHHFLLQATAAKGGFTGYPDWNSYTLATVTNTTLPDVDLDNVYPVVKGDHVVLQDGSNSWYTAASAVSELTRTGYLMSAKLTSINLKDPPTQPDQFHMRTTQVLVQTAQLPTADVLLDDPVAAGPLTLDGAYLSLAVGQLVALTGVRADKTGETASEVTSIASLSLVDGYTTVTFSPELTGCYRRSTVTLDANVAPATHGQTTTEILGSGNASHTFQRFPLKQSPLTYVSAATPSGAASTLVVRVNGVKWTEVPWLYGSGPADQVYTVLSGIDGKTYIQFGDGVTGARPGSGSNNIQATYRNGIGSAGLARAGQISTLLSRPLGLKAVTNPLPSSGAADPETIDQARSNAPTSVTTIDRIVSLEDVGNFAATSAGIAKAAASWIWDGSRYVACVTAAGVGGAPVAPGTDQYNSLLQAMVNAGDGTLPLTLCSYVPRTFTVAATITPDPALVPSDVLAAVKAALADAFGFAARSFGQPVFSSEVIATMQNVPGVVALALNDFNYSGVVSAGPLDALPAAAPTLGANGLVGAQLLTLEAGPLPRVVLAS
jgi:predicted phage baseplate assembly protein